MDAKRAEQILNMDDTVEVQHQGESVWIDNVDADNAVARVHKRENPSDNRVVPIEELQEV